MAPTDVASCRQADGSILTLDANGQIIPSGDPLAGQLPGPAETLPACQTAELTPPLGAQLVDEHVTGPFRDGMAGAVKTLTTFWTNTASPEVADGAGAVTGVASWLQGSLSTYVALVMAISIVARGALIAWQRRGEAFQSLVAGVARYVIVAGAGAAVVSVLLTAGDAFSTWIIDASLEGTSFGDRLADLLGGNNLGGSVGTIGAVALLIVAMIVSFGQAVLMVIRAGVLVILVGAWPFSAAAGITEAGSEWWTKTTAWITAFVLYKPAASLIYAGAFRLLGTPEGGENAGVTVLSGVGVICLAILALPALVRLCVSHTAPVASGKGMGQTAAGAAALLVAGRR